MNHRTFRLVLAAVLLAAAFSPRGTPAQPPQTKPGATPGDDIRELKLRDWQPRSMWSRPGRLRSTSRHSPSSTSIITSAADRL